MINSEIIAKIKTLLAEKRYSMRTIAKITGVSRGTITAIAADKRKISDKHRHAEKSQFEHPDGKPKRCYGCGGFVQMPCLACQLRKNAALNDEC